MRAELVVLLLAAACSSTSGSDSASDAAAPRRDAGPDAVGVARHEAGRGLRDAARARDGAVDAASVDAGHDATVDVTLASTALVRLANWSPDAPGIDLCVAPHATSLWSPPLLAAAMGDVALGHLTVKNADLSKDAASGPPGQPDAASDAGSRERDAGGESGVHFLRMSPYVSLTPGAYDVRVVKAGSADCKKPLLPELDDAPTLTAGSVLTLALVGDTAVAGADPALSLAFLPDDTSVAASDVRLRFVNAVPSVIEVTFASGTVATASAMPYLVAAQFGSPGVDTDAGPLDSNDYLTTAPIADQIWSLINANGGVSTLVAVRGASVPAARFATVVGVGGESGSTEGDIGILVCTDEAPIVAGETASCTLLQEAAQAVCGGGC